MWALHEHAGVRVQGLSRDSPRRRRGLSPEDDDARRTELRRRHPPRLPATRPRHAARRRAGHRAARRGLAADGGDTPAAKAKAASSSGWTAGRRTTRRSTPSRTPRPSIRGEFKPIATARARRALLRAHDEARRRSPTSSPSIRSIRHDQGNHGAGNHYMMTGAPPRIPVGCGAFVSFHPSLGSVVAHEKRRPGRAAGVLLACRACRAPAGRTSSAPSTPRSSSPATRTATASASATWPCRDGLTGERFDDRADVRGRGRPLPAHPRQGRRRPGRRPRRALPAGLRPDARRRRPRPRSTSAASRTRVRDALRPQRLRPAGPARPAAGRGRRAVRHLYDGGWDHHTKLFDVAQEAAADVGPDRRRR